MYGGILVVSRMILAHGHIKKLLEDLGFRDVAITAAEKDGLNLVINELKPRLILIGCGFYQSATPFLMGRLLRNFPGLNIAAVSIIPYPLDLGVSFIDNGVKSYLNYADGPDQFYSGLDLIRDGRKYISPSVEERMETSRKLPSPATDLTGRQIEALRLLCNGFMAQEIAEILHISKRTVEFHREELYQKLNTRNTCELVRVALYLGIIRIDELHFHGGDYQTSRAFERKNLNGGKNVYQFEKPRKQAAGIA
jgi:DNA-binding NarL/FixJ family response regulator